MTTIKFTIHGNQEGTDGNPIPYHRATQGSRWNPASQRYARWKEFVQFAFFDAIKDDPNKKDLVKDVRKQLLVCKKPISSTRRIRVDVVVHWANNAHADPDNILKGINDALFQNDKNVACSVDFDEAVGPKGFVQISITL